MSEARLPPDLFDFLFDLDVTNERTWFEANRDRYETSVREPVLGLIRDLDAPVRRRVSRHLVADDARQGGSMFRPHRDVRFSTDKRPYKTHAAFQLRHELGRDVHAPGIYIHLEPGNVFLAAGMYQPDTATLNRLRDDIVDRPGVFRRLRTRVERGEWGWGGDRLARGPKGYDRDHELIAELCRTSWILVHPFEEHEATSPGFAAALVDRAVEARPLLSWQCRVLGLPW